MSTCWARRVGRVSIGLLAFGCTCCSNRTKRREWRVSSPISCSRYMTRGSVRSGRIEMSNPNPHMSTDSKRTPVSTIEANSSRERVRFWSSVSVAKISGTCDKVRRSSGRIWPSPTSPGTSTSGSRMRLSEAVDRRSMRWSTDLAGADAGALVVPVALVVSMVEAIPTFFIKLAIASIPYFL